MSAAQNHRYERCKVCGQFGWAKTHACPPEWEWRDDCTHSLGEWDHRRVRARDAEDAATAAAELYDEEDYPLVRGGEAVIWVKRFGAEDVSKWNVHAESVPHYYANPVDEDDC